MFNIDNTFLFNNMDIDMRKYKHDQFSLLLFIIFNQVVKVVISKSFERIHRNNFEDVEYLSLTRHDRYSIDIPKDITQLKLGKDIIVTTDTGKCVLCF